MKLTLACNNLKTFQKTLFRRNANLLIEIIMSDGIFKVDHVKADIVRFLIWGRDVFNLSYCCSKWKEFEILDSPPQKKLFKKKL